MQDIVNNIIDRLENVHGEGGKYRATCPSHGSSKNQSLIVFDNGDSVGIHCHGGCDYTEVLSVLGMEAKDLYEEAGTDKWREIQASKRAVIDRDNKAQKLYLELTILKQCLEGRIFGDDKHPKNITECWNREKRAITLIAKYMSDYYGT